MRESIIDELKLAFRGRLSKINKFYEFDNYFGFIQLKKSRFAHYISIENLSDETKKFLEINGQKNNSEYLNFINSISGGSFYCSTVHLYGDREMGERNRAVDSWAPFSLVFENKIDPMRLIDQILVGSITCYQHKFNIYINQKGGALLKCQNGINRISTSSFLKFTDKIDEMISIVSKDGLISDRQSIDLEKIILSGDSN